MVWLMDNDSASDTSSRPQFIWHFRFLMLKVYIAEEELTGKFRRNVDDQTAR